MVTTLQNTTYNEYNNEYNYHYQIRCKELHKLLDEIDYFKKNKKLRNYCKKQCIHTGCNLYAYKPKNSYMAYDNCNYCMFHLYDKFMKVIKVYDKV